MSDAEQGTRPTLHVISGDATPEEIAAILAIVTARGQAIVAEKSDPSEASVWADRGSGHRATRARFQSSTHGWRTSYWPR